MIKYFVSIALWALFGGLLLVVCAIIVELNESGAWSVKSWTAGWGSATLYMVLGYFDAKRKGFKL